MLKFTLFTDNITISNTDNVGHCKLDVNGTGPRDIVVNNKNIEANKLLANHVYEFIYNPTNYELVSMIDEYNYSSRVAELETKVVELSDEITTKITEQINTLKQSFQDGCSKIVGKLTALSYPPANPQGPDEINVAIDKMYSERYSAGLAASSATTGNAKIVYTYHHHTGSTTAGGGCYTAGYHVHTSSCSYRSKDLGVCPGEVRYVYGDHYQCTACSYGGDGRLTGAGHHRYGTEYTCGYPVNRYNLGCGKSEGQIEKAEITFG